MMIQLATLLQTISSFARIKTKNDNETTELWTE